MKLASEQPQQSWVLRTPSIEYWDSNIPREKLETMAKYLEDVSLLPCDYCSSWPRLIIPQFKVIPKEELPNGVGFGISCTSVTINAPNHLRYLYDRLKNEFGVTFIRQKLPDIQSAFINPSTRLVFNCTGNASATLPGVTDTSCYPTRGQVVLTRAPGVTTNIMRHGKDYETYVIPRPYSNGNVILGGYMQKGNG